VECETGKKGYSRDRQSIVFNLCHGAFYGGRYLVPRCIRATDVEYRSTLADESAPIGGKKGEVKKRRSSGLRLVRGRIAFHRLNRVEYVRR
jgi:hypothetical protein